MTVIALTSARGAPGVTTTALALTMTWPRPVLLLEADVSGSSSILAGYLGGTRSHDRGLIDLALAHRSGTLFTGLQQSSVDLPGSKKWLLPGLVSPAQAGNLRPVWDPLATVLSGLEREGMDVIIDAGRLGAEHAPMPLLRQAEVTLLVTRTTLPAIAATRARAKLLAEDLAQQGTGSDGFGLLLIGDGQPYSAREIVTAVGVPVIASIGWDPVHAEVYSVGTPARRLETSVLTRSVTAAASSIQQLATSRRTRLAPGSLVGQEGHTHA
ncbi:MinD-like ATPase involved in chromosome partitioning or flagellar assembly [Modestobacter sp. DSM 44400]|uniref:hypothetical protein n=1 Tax=Modestobacter sp. DSM 44400 TaxID=1550230 RepID=UPI000899C4AF|nr:hypothetical protein [Modestobacter sp. DSM 44400]SDY76676.1 MinD-like ATPase involved in chromosome partitioning or flagellar assembly [Modestobacter sp. DSM 44400]